MKGKTRTSPGDGQVVAALLDRHCERTFSVYQAAAAWLETVQLGEEGLKGLDLIGCTKAPEDSESSFSGGTRARAIARRL